jgi:antitoxin (DNA-binding transcriptional repressor) of toxin-antitoxin stability system
VGLAGHHYSLTLQVIFQNIVTREEPSLRLLRRRAFHSRISQTVTTLTGELDARDRRLRGEEQIRQVLDWVEHGEEVTITRHGKEVARLVPSRAGFNRDAARAAAARIRAMSKGVTLGKLKIKDLINAGRR